MRIFPAWRAFIDDSTSEARDSGSFSSRSAAAAGFIAWLIQQRRPSQSASLPIHRSTHLPTPRLLLALSALLTFLTFVGYNLTFVQHQGRYLFPALIPLGTAAALGLSMVARVLPQRIRAWMIGALFAGLAALDVYCLFKFIIPFLAR